MRNALLFFDEGFRTPAHLDQTSYDFTLHVIKGRKIAVVFPHEDVDKLYTKVRAACGVARGVLVRWHHVFALGGMPLSSTNKQGGRVALILALALHRMGRKLRFWIHSTRISSNSRRRKTAARCSSTCAQATPFSFQLARRF